MTNGWKEYRLGEIAEIDMGQSPAGETCNEKGIGKPLLNGPTEFGSSFPTAVQFTTDPKRSSRKGDILFCVRGSTTGRMNWSNKEYAIGRGLAAIRHKQGGQYRHFLRGLIDNNLSQLLGLATGSTFPNIGGDQLRNFPVQIPPLKTQQEIASILSAFDDKMELNRQMNHTLEAIAQTLFTDLTSSDDKVSLESYIDLNPRLSIKKDKVVKYVEMRDVPESGFSIQSYVLRPFGSGSKFQQCDTLLARITPCLENGKTGFVDFLEEDEIGFGSTEFIVMRAKPGVSPYFVYLLARTPDFRGYAIKSMVGTSGRQRVQSDMLPDFIMSRVSETDMQQFHRTVQPLFRKIRTNSLENQTLTQLRDSLLPKLMSGQIPVGANA